VISLSHTSHQNPVCISLLPLRATRPTCHILPNLNPLIIFGDQYKSWSCSLRIFLQSPLTFPLISPNTFLSTLCSKSLSSKVHKFSQHPRATSKAQALVPYYGPESLGATVQNSVAWKTWRPGFLHPCPTLYTFLNVRDHISHPYTKQAKLQ